MVNNTNLTIKRIKKKIANQNLEIGKPLTSSEIKKFECQYEIILPKDYRQFLTQIGNGGDSPIDYGLQTLEKTVTSDMQPDKPFPLTKYWIWEIE